MSRPVVVTYDKDGNKIPTQQFLAMLIILLNNCYRETGMSLVQYLEDFEINDPEGTLDSYDDKALRKAIQHFLNDVYPQQ